MNLFDEIMADLAALKNTTPDIVGRSVLITDDSKEEASELRRELASMGLIVDTAHNVGDAMTFILAHEPYRMLFIDLRLNGPERGTAILKTLRRQIPEQPVTIVSNYIDDTILSLARELNYKVIQKPAKKSELIELFK